MLIVGAKGMAIEILEILSCEMKLKDKEILFFDNLNKDIPDFLFERFKVIKDYSQIKDYFKNHSAKFTLGLGEPKLRALLASRFVELGGEFTTVISSKSQIGSFNTKIGKGCQIMQNVLITNDVSIGDGVLINLKSSISHNTIIGDNVEIACGVTISGRCNIQDNVFIGSNSVLNSDLKIGANSILGSGSVVIDNVPENVTVVGNPSRIIRHHE